MRYAIIVCLLAWSLPAAADDPVVVVVESSHPRVRGASFRRALARRGIRSVSVLDPTPESLAGTLVVAVRPSGARMSFTAFDGSVHVRYLDLEPAQGLARVVSRAAALIETAHEMAAARAEGNDDEAAQTIVNPWREPVPPATAVNDPWANEQDAPPGASEQASPEPRRRRLAMHSEVLDPWAGTDTPVSTTPTQALRPHTEVLDPWANEREAETLRAFEESPRGRETGDHLTPPRS